MDLFAISQILGIVVSISAIISMQLKDVRLILFFQLVCNTLGAASYILIGGLSGCGIYIVALTQTIVFYFLRLKNIKSSSAITILFVLAYLLCSAFTFHNWKDVFSMIAALTCALALSQEKPSMYRVFMLSNGVIWMVYDVSMCAYTMIISHFVTALSAFIGMYRLDIRKKQA